MNKKRENAALTVTYRQYLGQHFPSKDLKFGK